MTEREVTEVAATMSRAVSGLSYSEWSRVRVAIEREFEGPRGSARIRDVERLPKVIETELR